MCRKLQILQSATNWKTEYDVIVLLQRSCSIQFRSAIVWVRKWRGLVFCSAKCGRVCIVRTVHSAERIIESLTKFLLNIITDIWWVAVAMDCWLMQLCVLHYPDDPLENYEMHARTQCNLAMYTGLLLSIWIHLNEQI